MNEQTTTEKPKSAQTHWMYILVLVALAAGVLWYVGFFKSRPKVALITSSDTSYWNTVIAGAEEAARVYDVDLTVVRSKADVQEQTDSIRKLMASNPEGIAISPINPGSQASLLAEIAGRTTLVTFDSDAPVSQRLCFIGTDNYAAGRLCGDQIRAALPEGGEIILCINNIEKENAQHRRQGVIDELMDRENEPNRSPDPLDAPIKNDKYTILTTLVDGADPQAATTLAAGAIKANPNLKCLVGLLGYSTPALLEALEQTGKLGQIKVVGFDVADETLNGIEAGHVYATILQDQFGCGFHTVRILAESARGDHTGLPMFQRRTLPCEAITKDRVGILKAQLAGKPVPATSPTNGEAPNN